MHSPLESYTTINWVSQPILVTAALPQFLNSYGLPTELRGYHKDTQLTTKCSWLNSRWSCFSNSAFSSGDFCKEFKASSPNSRFRVALIFSPGSTIPWQAKKYQYPHSSLGIAFFEWCVLQPPASRSGSERKSVFVDKEQAYPSSKIWSRLNYIYIKQKTVSELSIYIALYCGKDKKPTKRGPRKKIFVIPFSIPLV